MIPANYSREFALLAGGASDYASPRSSYEESRSSMEGNSNIVFIRAKRKQVKSACVNCRKACRGCDEVRPCQRCVRRGIQDTCQDAPRRPRASSAASKLRSGVAKALQAVRHLTIAPKPVVTTPARSTSVPDLFGIPSEFTTVEASNQAKKFEGLSFVGPPSLPTLEPSLRNRMLLSPSQNQVHRTNSDELLIAKFEGRIKHKKSTPAMPANMANNGLTKRFTTSALSNSCDSTVAGVSASVERAGFGFTSSGLARTGEVAALGSRFAPSQYPPPPPPVTATTFYDQQLVKSVYKTPSPNSQAVLPIHQNFSPMHMSPYSSDVINLSPLHIPPGVVRSGPSESITTAGGLINPWIAGVWTTANENEPKLLPPPPSPLEPNSIQTSWNSSRSTSHSKVNLFGYAQHNNSFHPTASSYDSMTMQMENGAQRINDNMMDLSA